MKKEITILLLVLSTLFITHQSFAQDSLKFYINAGYLTSFIKPDDNTSPDDGGSIRIGVLTKKRLGYYAGYAWFKEYHSDYIEYDDKGSLFLAGINYRLFGKKATRCYLNAGLAFENFISVYRMNSKKESEFTVKPELGLLFNINFINLFLGWQPSDAPHYILGVGFTFNIKSDKTREE